MIKTVKTKLNSHICYPENDSIVGQALENDRIWEEPLIKRGLGLIGTGDVIDCGAYIGTHSIEWARKAKQVYSFEPVALSYKLLELNVLLNGLENVQTRKMGLFHGPDNGFLEISKPDIHNEVSNLAHASCLEDGEHKISEKCLFVSLDAELERSNHSNEIDLIKIDCEGMEYEVLQGAAKTIGHHKPHIIMEYNQQYQKNFEKMDCFLTDIGYEFVEWVEGGYGEIVRDKLWSHRNK
ncbi:MAG: FkbM family methyltransferase [Gammaproteobacteria bacterium]|nr:FkbM family methyltransferase [Gammaproteobacteria bacterium]